MEGLDEVIHQPTRLRVMSALCALEPGVEAEFTALRDLLGLTDGNLGAHLRRLEEAGYIRVRKTFVGRRPRTYLSATDLGRHAFRKYRDALRALLGEENAG